MRLFAPFLLHPSTHPSILPSFLLLHILSLDLLLLLLLLLLPRLVLVGCNMPRVTFVFVFFLFFCFFFHSQELSQARYSYEMLQQAFDIEVQEHQADIQASIELREQLEKNRHTTRHLREEVTTW